MKTLKRESIIKYKNLAQAVDLMKSKAFSTVVFLPDFG